MAVLGFRRAAPLGNACRTLAVLGHGLSGSLFVGPKGDGAHCAIDKYQRAAFNIAQRGTYSNDARNIQLTGDDGRMAGRSTKFGNKGLDVLGIQRRGIGRGQIVREQHGLAVYERQARLVLAAQLCDYAVAHVLQVSGALGHHAAGGLEHGDKLIGGTDSSEFRVPASADILAHRLMPTTVLNHAGRCGQNFRSLAFGGSSPLLQAASDSIYGRKEAVIFRIARLLWVNASLGRQGRARADPHGFGVGDSGNDTGSFDCGLRRVFHERTSFEDSGLLTSRTPQIG